MIAPVYRSPPQLLNIRRLHLASSSSGRASAAAATGPPTGFAAKTTAGSHRLPTTAISPPGVSTVRHRDSVRGTSSSSSVIPRNNGGHRVSNRARPTGSESPSVILPTTPVSLTQGLDGGSSFGLTPRPKPRDSDAGAVVESDNTSHHDRPLDKLPATTLWRSLANHIIMTQPSLVSLATSPFVKRNLNRLGRNPIARIALNNIFYPQFCAGATDAEIQRTVSELRDLGYKGVIIHYARELEIDGAEATEPDLSKRMEAHVKHVNEWLAGTLQTIRYSSPGDFVAIKFTGAGPECVHMLERAQSPDETMGKALSEVCQSARDQGVRIMIDAEHYVQQKGIDMWTMDLQRRYNVGDHITVYNTYQMYLKDALPNLTRDLELAKASGFNFGAKLVRGAYIGSDPRSLIHDTKAATDEAYDRAATMLATANRPLQQDSKPESESKSQSQSQSQSQPRIGFALATHNKDSIQKMRALRQRQFEAGELETNRVDLIYAQLMGMADELSLNLTKPIPNIKEEPIQAYKYVVWGTPEECLLYLMRRVEENKDALGRGAESRSALWQEVKTRLLGG